MIRDSFKDEQYFGAVLSRLEATLDLKRAELRAKERPYYMEYYAMADGLESYIKLGYSFGWPVRSLVAAAHEMLEDYTLSIEQGDDYSDGGGLIYAGLLNMIAIGVLLDTTSALQHLASKLAEVGFKDYLVSYLLRYAQPGYEVPEGLIWSEDACCVRLREITLSEKGQAAALLLDYLGNMYYTRDNLEDDYGAHKRPGNAYLGYWSFESAAIAKIMELDDTDLKQSKFYPGEMRHGDNRSMSDCPPLSSYLQEELNNTNRPQPVPKKKWWQFWML